MTPSRIILSTLGALAVLLASACEVLVEGAPAASSPTADASATPARVETAAEAATQPPVQPEATLAPTEAAVQPVATSRGPELHATDPTTVKLASGQLQLVEFFRFT